MKNLLTNLLVLLVLIFLITRLADELDDKSPPPLASRGTLTIGAEPIYPYQYEQSASDSRLTGLSTELVREACSRAGYRVNFVQQDWFQLLESLRKGEIDALSLAYRSPEREAYGHFSLAYLSLHYSVFYRTDSYRRLPDNPAELLAIARRDEWRIGYSMGHAYPQEVQTILNDGVLRLHSVGSKQEAETMARLINGQVDIVFADELAGMSTVMRNRWILEIGSRRLDIPLEDTHILFSKARVAPEVRTRIDSALLDMEADGTTAAIVRAYHYPVLLSLLERNFFFDPIGLLAVATAAASGIFLARKEGYNLLGAFLMAAAPAVGGGLLRDLIAGRRPVAFVADPSIMTTVLIMVLAGFLLFRLVTQFWPDRMQRLLELDVDNIPLLILCDALGLACFTVIGVAVAMQWRCEPLWLWGPLLAAATNGGGSLLRDILRHQPSVSLRTTKLYVEISILWGLALSVFLIYYSAHPPHQVGHLQMAMLATMLGVGLTRFLTVRNKLHGPTY
ncbi:MAG: transporter substrate-binding domain-containing protein [Candidatus Eremiobacteraeota bacterium]|nr:transporter substrate-binding domain-containing protein [Candidatus Eremiobacteraeota bacterium]